MSSPRRLYSLFQNGLFSRQREAHRRRRRIRSLSHQTLPLRLEMLEPRLMLASDLYINGLDPIGSAGSPFSAMEVSFSKEVDEATFTVDDVTIGGTGSPIVDSIVRLDATRYQINLGGTGLGTYNLSIGPAILDTLGVALDQDGDGTAGETSEDAYVAALFSAGLTIADTDATYDGQNIVIYGGTATVDGPHAFESLAVLGGATLTHSPTDPTTERRLELTVTEKLWIDSASKIDVSARGYTDYYTAGNTTTGGAAGHAGGSYGGLGVYRHGETNAGYGDFRDPDAPGSGGAGERDSAGSGGGLVRITAGSAAIDGTILADGGDGAYVNYRSGGGGSGGGVLLDVGTLAGSGTISANGGRGYGGDDGSGGGGRVAVYYDTLQGFDLASQITAHGNTSVTGAAAAGTLYLEDGLGRGTLRIDSHATTAGVWTPLGTASDAEIRVDELVLAGAGVVAAPEHEIAVYADNVSIFGGAVLTHRPTTAEQVYSLRMQLTGDLTVDSSSAIHVTGRGFIDHHTTGNSTKHGATNMSGGSYGGRGADRHGVAGIAYGRPDYPYEPGSGGAGERDSAGSGGGMIHITAATITVDGRVVADGQDGLYYDWRTGGAGSGGAVLLNAVTLAGSGTISADGGDGYGTETGAGGGGRVAVYYRDSVTLPEANITANGGTQGSSPGEDGSVFMTSDIHGEWLSPRREMVHGAATIGWEYLAADPAVMQTTLTATRDGQTIEVASGRATSDSVVWNTTAVADGIYQLRLTLRDSGGPWVHELNREVVVNNSVHWHSGRITADETWSADKVHVVEDDLVIAAGVTVTLAPGAVVKFAPGVALTIEDTAILDADGATSDAAIVFTAVADDVGGDTTRDGARSRPVPGAWDGVVLKGTGQFLSNEFVKSRYSVVKHEGTLASNEVWLADFLHHITGRLTVPYGVTLTIDPGAVVKFDAFDDMIVQGTLLAEGTVAQPIVFTSIYDDSVAGDTNRDGENSQPAAGDWRTIEVAGTARFDHAHLAYGSGTASRVWEQTGALRTHYGSTLMFSNSVLRDAFFDGILVWGGHTTITNSLITGTDRGILAHPEGMVNVVHSTVDDNRLGLVVHGGRLNVSNSLVTNSLEVGIQFDFTWTTDPLTVRSTNVWSTMGSNYGNTADLTGTSGNVSVDPKYKNRAQGNYRLQFGSPAIDAADGTLSPATDFMGAPRYDDPRTANTGVAMADGSVPDMGAFEFVESAASEYDLVVTSVVGPTDIRPGQTARVAWTVRNAGSGAVQGAWHDAIRLVTAGLGGEGFVVAVDEILSSGTLGPGGTLTFAADVVVSPAADGLYRWEVMTNSRGGVFEGINWNNNRTRASVATGLLMPELALAEIASGSFSGSGDRRYYKLELAAGQDVRLVLDRADGSGRSDVYVRRGALPTRQEFDFRSTSSSPDATLMVPSTSSDVYYVMLDPASVPGGSAAYTFSAEAVELGLASIGVPAGSNLGTVSLPLVGAGFRSGLQVELVAGDGTAHAAESLTVINSTSARARFDLVGLAEGVYDVRIRQDGWTETLADTFTVNAEPLGRVETRVSLPEIVRIGREFTAWIEYTNVGATDVAAPLIYVSSPTGNQLRFADTESYEDELALIAVGSRGEAGVLAPGETGRIAVRAVGRTGANTIQTRIATVDNSTTVDWEMWREEVRPETASAEWDAVWNTQVRAGASTLGELVQMFSQAATRYAELMGEATYDTNRTLRLAVLDALQEDATALSLSVYLDHLANPLSWVTVTAAEQISGEVYSAFAMANGLARFAGLPDGTYNLAVPGYLPETLIDPATITGNRVDVGTWVLSRGGQIQGRVSAPSDTEYSSGQITIAAVDGEGAASFATPAADGRFSISGLIDGTYTLHISGAGIAPLTITGIAVVEGAITEMEPIHLLPTGSISGVVRDAVSGQPLSGITITLLDMDHAVTVSTDADGAFLLEGISVGTQQITANGGAHVQATRTVTVEAGQTTGGIDFTLQRSAVVSGTVTFGGAAVAEAGVSVKDGTGAMIGYARTGADGTYRIADLDPAGYTLEVDHWRYAVHSQSITLESGASATHDVALAAAGMVSGTLTETTSGLPMNNMAVLLLRPDGSITPTTTASDGTFAFSRLEAGNYTVMLPDGSHRQQVTIAGADDHVSVTMNLAVGGVTGAVVGRDGVLPVTNATAWLIKDGQVVLSSGVDETGRFLQLLVSPGVYDLYVASPEYVYAIRTGITIAGAEITDLGTFYPGGATLIVTLRDAATGEIFTEGGALAVRPVGIPDAVSATRWIAIGSTGVDALQDLELGQYRVIATATGKTVVDSVVTVDAGFEPIEVSLAEQSTLSGTVNAPGGVALEGIGVLAYDPAHPELVWDEVTDDAGGYMLAGLPAGQYTVVFTDQRVEASGDRYRIAQVVGLAIAAGELAVQNTELALADTTLSGSITTADNSPPLGATIEVLNSDGVVVAVVSADAQGQYSVTTLSAGDYTVRGMAKGYVLGTAAVTLVAGEIRSGIDLAATWYADPFADWLGNLYASGESWAGSFVQSMLDGLAHILGEPKRAPRHTRTDPGIECPIADLWWAQVEHYQQHSDDFYDGWRQRWEAAVGVGSANLGIFGAQLGTFALQLYIAKNMPPDSYGPMFLGSASRLMDDFNRGLINSEQYVRALNSMRATYDALVRMTGANVVGGIGNGILGEWTNVGMEAKTTLGKLSDTVGELMADATQWSKWLTLANGLGELVGYLDTIIAGLELMGASISWSNPVLMAKLNTIMGGLKVLEAASDGIRSYINDKNDLIRKGEEYDQIIFKRDKAYYNYLRALADCRDKEDDKPNPNPIPAPSSLPPGGGGTAGGGGSLDPNDKATIGYGTAGWIAPQSEIFYKIRFENMATAELPAQEVVVTDSLDASLDWSTLELVGIGFNGAEIEIPAGLREYTTRVTVASDPNPVDVAITFHADTGVLTWTMRSVDAATGELPEDPLAGFLPPNDDEHRGEGYVTFRIRPVAGLANGATIENRAEIVFDVNDPINTNVVVNTIDTVTPTSEVAPLPAETALSSTVVSWSGTDATGSGIAAYDLFVSDHGGPFTLWLAGTAETSATFVGTPGHTYAFYSVATDGVGYREAAPGSADTQITLGSGITVTEDLGMAGLTERGELNPAAGILWYSFQSIRDGLLTLLADSADPAGTVRMVLTDADGTVLTYSSATNGRERIDLQTTAGTSYLLGLMGTSTSATLGLANLVHQDGTAVTVFGTDAADTFDFGGSTVRQVTINGFDYRFLSTAAGTIRFDGAGGDDTAVLRGSAAAETVELRPGSATLSRTGLEVQVVNVAQITAIGGGGNNVARLYDSAGDDQFIARLNSGRLAGDGFDNGAEGFSGIHAYAIAGGHDVARLFGSGTDDLYLGTPGTGRLIGAGAEVSASSFDQVALEGRGGHDTARLIRFGRNDLHIAASRFDRIVGADTQIWARSFERVVLSGKTHRHAAHPAGSEVDTPEMDALQTGEFVAAGAPASADSSDQPTTDITVSRIDMAHSDHPANAQDMPTSLASAGDETFAEDTFHGELYVAPDLPDANKSDWLLRHAHFSGHNLALLVTATSDGWAGRLPLSPTFTGRELPRARLFREIHLKRGCSESAEPDGVSSSKPSNENSDFQVNGRPTPFAAATAGERHFRRVPSLSGDDGDAWRADVVDWVLESVKRW